jgi:hypothetical protein
MDIRKYTWLTHTVIVRSPEGPVIAPYTSLVTCDTCSLPLSVTECLRVMWKFDIRIMTVDGQRIEWVRG